MGGGWYLMFYVMKYFTDGLFGFLLKLITTWKELTRQKNNFFSRAGPFIPGSDSEKTIE